MSAQIWRKTSRHLSANQDGTKPMPKAANVISPLVLPALVPARLLASRPKAASQTLLPNIIKGSARMPLHGPVSRQPQAAMFAAFATGDTIEAAVGANQQRQAAGKPARPLIAANPKEAAQLRALKLQHLEQCRAKALICMQALKSLGPAAKRQLTGQRLDHQLHQLQQGLAYWKTWQQLSQDLVILSNVRGKDLAALSGKDKLYILAHGDAGSDALHAVGADGKWLSLNSTQMASKLKTSGLRASFRDVRVASCHSADARSPKSFDPSELQACSKPCIKRVNGKPVLRLPFAQGLSQALQKQGYTATSVTGYHGTGLPFQLIDAHQKRGLAGHPEICARASQVSRQFGPQLPHKTG